MKKILLHSIILFLFCFHGILFGQTLVNQVMQDTTGSPTLNFPFQAACRTSDNGVVIVGNTYSTTSGSNLLVSKYSSTGAMLWQFQYGVSADSGGVYGVDVFALGSYVYVAGAITGPFNVDAILKITSDSGQIVWVQGFGAVNYVVPSKIVADSSGNVYVASTAEITTGESAMVITKFNSSGTQLWVHAYDTAGMYSGATAIALPTDGDTDITVTGFSGTGFGSWNFLTGYFGISTGSLMSTKLTTNGDGSFSSPAGVGKDYQDRVYIAGTAAYSGSNTDIKIIAYDSAYNQRWVADYGNVDSLADSASRMTMDADANILITGYTTASNNAKQLLVLKYSNGGSLLWSRTVAAPNNPSYNCAGNSITSDDSLNVYVTGYFYNGATNNNDFISIAFDKNGNTIWEKSYDGGGTNDVANDIVVNNNDVFVSGISSRGVIATYLTLEYQTKKVIITDVTDTGGNPLYVGNEIIVKFNPNIVNRSIVNNLGWEYGSLTDVIPDSVINAMSEKLGIDSKIMGAATVVKIFMQMTTADSLSVTRLGDTIPTPEFWSAFRLLLPSSLDVPNVADSLMTLHPDIEYADINFIGVMMSAPDDPYYDTAQAALHPTATYPNANINIEPAWDIETGKSYVKVGVNDVNIAWWNEDFGDGTFAGSKIAGGWDLFTNTSVSSVNSTNDSHGTDCAGIIGALRNNNKGIAGVAGGNVDTSVNSSTGCSLYSLGILSPQIYINCIGDTNYTTTLATVSAAIAQGAALSPDSTSHFGFGLNIESNSWGIYPGWATGCLFPPGPQYVLTPDINVLKDAVRFCFMNQCLIVAARGNEGYNDTIYPACFSNSYGWLISVGASGTDGEYKSTTNGDNWWSSSYGQGIDLIAPGTSQLITTTQDPNDTLFTADKCSNYSNPNYTCFNGTSSSAAFVSGVAALMLSRHNINQGYANNLAPDDIKNLVDDYTTPVIDSALGYYGGYDSLNGWGLLNAGAVMAAINAPKYRVFHSGNPQSTSYDTLGFTNPLVLYSNPYNITPGTYYNCMQVQVTQTYTNTFSSSTQILHNWPRLSSTIGMSESEYNDGSPWAYYNCDISANSASVIMTTYAWHITDTTAGIDQWIPTDPAHIKTAYSLQLYDSLAVATGIKEISSIADFNIYPNPTDAALNVSVVLPQVSNISISIKDITGRPLMEKQMSGSNRYLTSFSTLQLASGLYLCIIETNNGHQVRKFVKQ